MAKIMLYIMEKREFEIPDADAKALASDTQDWRMALDNVSEYLLRAGIKMGEFETVRTRTEERKYLVGTGVMAITDENRNLLMEL